MEKNNEILNNVSNNNNLSIDDINNILQQEMNNITNTNVKETTTTTKKLNKEKVNIIDLIKNNTTLSFFLIFNILVLLIFLSTLSTTFKKNNELNYNKEKIINLKLKNKKITTTISTLINNLISKTTFILKEEELKKYIEKLNTLNKSNLFKVSTRIEKNIYSNVLIIKLSIDEKNKSIFNNNIYIDLIYKELQNNFIGVKPPFYYSLSKKDSMIDIKIVSFKKSNIEEKRTFIINSLKKI